MTVQEAKNLAADHERAGRFDAAAELFNHLGIHHRQQGAAQESIAAFTRAISLKPAYPDAHNNLGNTLRALGRLDEAAACYRRAIEINPNHAAAHANLANVLADQGKFAESIGEYRVALEIQPEYPVARNNLANALRLAGRFAEAEFIASELVRSNANVPDFHLNLGNIFFEQEKYVEAIQAFEAAMKLQPSNSIPYNNLAMALSGAGRVDDSIAAARSATRLAPDYADGFNTLGNLLADEGQYDAAASAFAKAIQLRPNFAIAHWNYAAIPLLRGDFATGWAEHEWRKKTFIASAPRRFPQPEWNGEDAKGKTILIHTEQGFGDTIQFVRYVPLVVERGARVILFGPSELAVLLRESLPDIEVVATEPLPQFDLHCGLLSLPFIFQTRLETIPARVPYLTAPADKSAQWKARLKPDRLRVGVAWSGNPKRKLNRRRSLDPKLLAPLAKVDGVHFYSLQKGSTNSLPVELDAIDFTSELHDFSDTAALIANLDLVISVDTAVAHLAGAMGKPVWLLLGFVPAWRWLLDRTDSPWYPTMRLFRQSAMDDWGGPIAAVTESLTALVAR